MARAVDARLRRSGSAQHQYAILCPDDRPRGDSPKRLHIGASQSKPSSFPGGMESKPIRSGVSQAPDGRFQPADLRPGHTGAGQILSTAWKNPGSRPPIGVQLGVAKSNYHQVRRQKELSRKTRQQEKQQRRLAAKSAEPGSTAPDGANPVVSSGDPVDSPVASPSGDPVNAPIGGTSA